MRITINGVRDIIKDDLVSFFKDFKDRGYVYQITYQPIEGGLFDVSFDMGDLVISPILDGIEIFKKGDYYRYGNYYIDKYEFKEIRIETK